MNERVQIEKYLFNNNIKWIYFLPRIHSIRIQTNGRILIFNLLIKKYKNYKYSTPSSLQAGIHTKIPEIELYKYSMNEGNVNAINFFRFDFISPNKGLKLRKIIKNISNSCDMWQDLKMSK